MDEGVNIECVARLVLLTVVAEDQYAVRDRLGSHDADIAPTDRRVCKRRLWNCSRRIARLSGIDAMR